MERKGKSVVFMCMSLSLNVCRGGTHSVSKLMDSFSCPDIGLDWGVYQHCLSAWHFALGSTSSFWACLPTGSLCPYMYTSRLLTQTEIALFSHFILHLFSGIPGTGSLEPESSLASLSIAKPGCAAPERMGRGWELHRPDYTMSHESTNFSLGSTSWGRGSTG